MKKLTPTSNTRFKWVGKDGNTYRTKAKRDPRIRVSMSTYRGGYMCGAMHYYCRVRGDEPSIYDCTEKRELMMGGYGPNKPNIVSYNFDAERVLTEAEEDLQGEAVGNIGDTTIRFNDPLEAFKSGLECVFDNFEDAPKKKWKVYFDYCGDKLEGQEFTLEELRANHNKILQDFEFPY